MNFFPTHSSIFIFEYVKLMMFHIMLALNLRNITDGTVSIRLYLKLLTGVRTINLCSLLVFLFVCFLVCFVIFFLF